MNNLLNCKNHLDIFEIILYILIRKENRNRIGQYNRKE